MRDQLFRLFAVIDSSKVNLPKVNESNFFKTSLTLFSQLIGAVSVLVLAVAGLRYIMSFGDPQKTAQAKDAIIYASIGIAVSLAAYSIVAFVLNRI